MKIASLRWLLAFYCGFFALSAGAKTLEVGDGKSFDRIEKANAAAQAGDVILVYPLKNDRPYEKTAVFVQQKNLTFRAAVEKGKTRIKISGKGFDYSGKGSTPRAIFQFDRGADGCILEGFEIFGAHNESHNGAGVRINQANRTTVRNCSIHNNDMGVMSNGDGTSNTAAEQLIEHCEIHHNGDPGEPGQNHNLYLGGTSVILRFCDIHSSLTGHNVKSRAHQIRVEYCFIHDSSNREFDLVDSTDTALPQSHALLLGNIIVKDPKCEGNRSVIHFGQDGGKGRDGTLYLYFNTVVTPFVAPIVDLSTPQAKVELVGNLIASGDAKQKNQQLAAVRGGEKMQNFSGRQNWFAGDFTMPKDSRLDPQENRFGPSKMALFVNPAKNDCHLAQQAAQEAKTNFTLDQLKFPAILSDSAPEVPTPLVWQYHHPAGKEKRLTEKEIIYGAYGK
jgi:hypothetical protein